MCGFWNCAVHAELVFFPFSHSQFWHAMFCFAISSSTITPDINTSRLFYRRMLSQFKWLLQSRIIFFLFILVLFTLLLPSMSQFLCTQWQSREALKFDAIRLFFFRRLALTQWKCVCLFVIFKIWRKVFRILVRETAWPYLSNNPRSNDFVFFLLFRFWDRWNFSWKSITFLCNIVAPFFSFFTSVTRSLGHRLYFSFSFCHFVFFLFCRPETDDVSVFINSQHTIIAQLKQSHHINMHVFIFHQQLASLGMPADARVWVSFVLSLLLLLLLLLYINNSCRTGRILTKQRDGKCINLWQRLQIYSFSKSDERTNRK